MATTELGSGKTVIILAVVVGCFGVLWPRVFYPMMQAVFMAAKPRDLTQGLPTTDVPVCCGIIYENTINMKYFAELCHSVLEPSNNRARQRRGNSSPPPPGILDRCRMKILELCDLDINDLMNANKGVVKNYRIEIKATVDNQKPKLNLSECLEKHFQLGASNTKKPIKQTQSNIHQERPSRIGHGSHPALMERGQPFQTQRKVQPTFANDGGRTVSGIRPNIGAKPDAGSKGGGAMGFLMPIYTVGIIVFFLYTIAKVLLKKTQTEPTPNDTKPKINTFHMDPEYRKYVLSEQYHNNMPISYQEYLNLKENGVERDSEENETSFATKLLSNGGRKQVFTAIEGIIAEMDGFRERALVDQPPNLDENQIEDEDLSTMSNGADMQTAREELNDDQLLPKLVGPLSELSEHLRHIIQQDKAKIAVLGMETLALQKPKHFDPQPQNAEVSNIVLEKPVPLDAQLLVTESQCLTHTSVEHIDGWSECDDNPIIVTGKMTISLLGNDQMAVVNSAEQTTQEIEPEPTTPTPDLIDEEVEEEENNEEEEEEEEEEEVRRITNENTVFEMNGNAHISLS